MLSILIGVLCVCKGILVKKNFYSNYDNQYYRRRYQLPPGELEEVWGTLCAPTKEEATQGERLSPVLGRVRLVYVVVYKDGAWEFGVS